MAHDLTKQELARELYPDRFVTHKGEGFYQEVDGNCYIKRACFIQGIDKALELIEAWAKERGFVTTMGNEAIMKDDILQKLKELKGE